MVDVRASLLRASGVLDQVALDKYSFFRDAYLQRRRAETYDGNPPEAPDGDPGAGAIEDPEAGAVANPEAGPPAGATPDASPGSAGNPAR